MTQDTFVARAGISRALRGRTGLSAALLVAGMAASSAGCGFHDQADAAGLRDRAPVASVIGHALPAAELTDLTGARVALEPATSSTGTIVLVARSADCMSCTDYPLEQRILANEFPHLRVVLIVTGDTALLPDTFWRRQQGTPTFLDRDAEFTRALGIDAPAILVADASGRILHADHRAATASAHFTISDAVRRLAKVFSPPAE